MENDLVNSAPTTLVCFAVKEEARVFQRQFGGHPGLEIVLTGMGKRNAERTVRAALERNEPGRLITAGFAGGLSPDLATGMVVYCADTALGLESGLRAAGARRVRFHCANEVVSTAAQKRGLYQSTGADAVEMESQVIEEICRERQIPVATIRVILDTAAEDLALNFNEVMTPDQRIDAAKLALSLLKSPGKIPALMRLQKRSTAAAVTLGEALGRVLGLTEEE